MAWLIGSGLRLQSANSSSDLVQSAPASSSTSSTSLSTNAASAAQPASSTSATGTTSLDKAVRMLGGVDRERNSTGASSNLAKTGNSKTATGNVTDNNSVTNSGTTSKLGNTTNAQVVPGK
jgi:hypothetical protein